DELHRHPGARELVDAPLLDLDHAAQRHAGHQLGLAAEADRRLRARLQLGAQPLDDEEPAADDVDAELDVADGPLPERPDLAIRARGHASQCTTFARAAPIERPPRGDAPRPLLPCRTAADD